ncbi:MAG: prepilin-type N-terminal cleavage/methylation domain-containing protein [Deltaproteobacteria bacterium]|nr:prepilin-type N-terminal cleavage/methylation domain-containing protein [Deltaproteobacteria bacterium]
MFNIIWKNKKGMSLVESIVAMLLLSAAVIAIMTLQPTAWMAGGKADHTGRAVMVLHREMMAQEALIMNPCNTVTTGTVNKTVYAGSQSTAQQGDMTFNVQTTITAVSGSTNAWRVTITVSWPLNTTGVTDNLLVTRQEYFRYPDGCT